MMVREGEDTYMPIMHEQPLRCAWRKEKREGGRERERERERERQRDRET